MNDKVMNIRQVQNGYVISTGWHYESVNENVFNDWETAVEYLNQELHARKAE